MSNKQTTAVQWLVDKIDFLLPTYLIEEAKAIERKQIEEACDHISNIYEKHLKEDGDYFSSMDGSDYFTSTFTEE